MIMTVEELRRRVDTDKEDQALEDMLLALESSIKGYTNNSFVRVLAANNGQYPMDIQLGCADIIRWKLRNEAVNSGDTSQQAVQSESIARHSWTYAADQSEKDMDADLGVPKKHTAFLRPYMKARFGNGVSL